MASEPISKACVTLGVCETSLKRRCRDLGLQRWPYRELQQLQKKWKRLADEQVAMAHDADAQSKSKQLHAELDVLKGRIAAIMQEPGRTASRCITRPQSPTEWALVSQLSELEAVEGLLLLDADLVEQLNDTETSPFRDRTNMERSGSAKRSRPTGTMADGENVVRGRLTDETSSCDTPTKIARRSWPHTN